MLLVLCVRRNTPGALGHTNFAIIFLAFFLIVPAWLRAATVLSKACHAARGIVGPCCAQPTCVKCLAHTPRVALDDRLRSCCPLCRIPTLVLNCVVRRRMLRAYHSHAATIDWRLCMTDIECINRPALL